MSDSVLEKHTPLMKQYHEIKQSYPHVLLLFQVGDFYELFYQDAQVAAKFLGITLTARGKNQHNEPIPLCGFPVHTSEFYIAKLVRGGFHVAICQQLQEPTPGKVVERGVTQILTPGTLVDSKLLDERSPSYLFSFFPSTEKWGLLYAELLTAQIFVTELAHNSFKILENELSRFFPDEIIIPHDKLSKQFITYFTKLGYHTVPFELSSELQEQALIWCTSHIKDEQGIISKISIKAALSQFYAYINRNQKYALDQFKSIQWYQPEDFLIIDSTTSRNLELVTNMHDNSRKNSLLELLDTSCTPMGSRTLKKWLLKPFIKEENINQRLDAVETLINNISLSQQLQQILRSCADIERIIGRIGLKRASINDYIDLLNTLRCLPTLQQILSRTANQLLQYIVFCSSGFDELIHFLQHALATDQLNATSIIKKGFDQKLDDLHQLLNNSTALLLEFERTEQQKTGINSLKVGYNQLHGYYIEVTKANISSIPQYFIRYQTLVGKERYTTSELKKLEADLTLAKINVVEREKELLDILKQKVYENIMPLRKMSQALSTLDALVSLSVISSRYNYVRPTMNKNRDIIIKEGRHPVVERTLPTTFIVNDTILNDQQNLLIITGPNMGGKSTYLRQVAIIALMAHCGFFVPASSAEIPILDRIFTRIGAGDNVALGKSTFLVEMEEAALICSQSTKDSLVILDEVGRGTSTYDGLAIARAIVEYLHNIIKTRCLFATHYHELTELSHEIPGIANYYAASKMLQQRLLLLYKILPGVAHGSFGLEVAKLAELPEIIIQRAHETLTYLQSNQLPKVSNTKIVQAQDEVNELKVVIYQQQKVIDQLLQLNFDEISPKQAFDILWKLKELC